MTWLHGYHCFPSAGSWVLSVKSFQIDINQRRLVAPPARQERDSLDTGHGHDSNRIAFQERLAFKKGLVYVQDRWQTRAASQQTPHSKIRYHHWHASQLTASAEKGSMSTVQSPKDRSSCKLWIFPPFCPNLAWSKALLTLDTFQRLVPSIQKIWQSKIPMEWAIKSPASRKALQCLFCSSKLGLLDGKACNELDHMIHIDHMWARIIIRNLIWSLGRTVPKVHETGRRHVLNFLLRGIQRLQIPTLNVCICRPGPPKRCQDPRRCHPSQRNGMSEFSRSLLQDFS